MRSRRSDSLAEHFDFDVVVHRLARGTVRIDTHVAALRELGVDRAAIVALAVLLVRALAELGGVVVVVVEDRLHAVDEVRVVGDLHDHVLVDALVALVVPHADGGDRVLGAEVELDPLQTAGELEHRGGVRRLVAVDHVLVVARHGLFGRRDLRVLGRELLGELGLDHDRSAKLAGAAIGLEDVALDFLRRATRVGRGQFELDGDLVGEQRGGAERDGSENHQLLHGTNPFFEIECVKFIRYGAFCLFQHQAKRKRDRNRPNTMSLHSPRQLVI